MLSHLGYRAFSLPGSEAALEWLADRSCDRALLDMIMAPWPPAARLKKPYTLPGLAGAVAAALV